MFIKTIKRSWWSEKYRNAVCRYTLFDFLDSDDWLSIKFVEKFSKLMEWTDEKPEMVFTLPWVFDSVTNRILSWKDKEIYDSIFLK